MPDPTSTQTNFADEMERLAGEAERLTSRASGGSSSGGGMDVEVSAALLAMLRPLGSEISKLQEHFDAKVAELREQIKESAARTKEAEIEELRRVSEQMSKRLNLESANQKLFDQLHAELKSYRDDFIHESLHRPVIRDLIALHDDLRAHCQHIEDLTEMGASESTDLENLKRNSSNLSHFLLEILHRLGVEDYQTASETVDLQSQKVMRHEPAREPGETGLITQRLRPGFRWRGKTLRPEEVVVKKWTVPPDQSPEQEPSSGES